MAAAMYLVEGRDWSPGDEGLDAALARAYERRVRPVCTCNHVEMYIAKVFNALLVKRMPCSGSRHAPECPHYEPTAEVSGLTKVLGAIQEDTATGLTRLRLGFALSKGASRPVPAGAATERDSVSSDGTQLGLRDLLLYLWDQAELTRWRPGFAGKRNWTVVRSHLLRAARDKVVRGSTLINWVYVPEAFCVDRRADIDARRVTRFAPLAVTTGGARPLLLLIGEVKEVVAGRFHRRLVIKHLPDQAFVLDEPIFRRMARLFESELALWEAMDSSHLMVIATFGLDAARSPQIIELSLVLMTAQWIPIADSFEQRLIDRLVSENRSFIATLRLGATSPDPEPCVVLLDTVDAPLALTIDRSTHDQVDTHAGPSPQYGASDRTTWVWSVAFASIPPLPARS